MRQTWGIIFGTGENRKCCPQHGALNGPFAGLAFSAATIAFPEPFLLPTAENWYPVGGMFWRQDRTLILIAEPRWRSGSNHNTEL